MGDISAPNTAGDLVEGEGSISVFHFASMMSGNSEEEFDNAWDVNVLASTAVLAITTTAN